MFSEGGNEGWERFRKRQGKTLRKILSKARKLEKNKKLGISKLFTQDNICILIN